MQKIILNDVNMAEVKNRVIPDHVYCSGKARNYMSNATQCGREL